VPFGTCPVHETIHGMRFQKGSIGLRSGSFYVRAEAEGKQKNFFLASRQQVPFENVQAGQAAGRRGD